MAKIRKILLPDGKAHPLKNLPIGTTGVHKDNGKVYLVKAVTGGKKRTKAWVLASVGPRPVSKKGSKKPKGSLKERAYSKFKRAYRNQPVGRYMDGGRKAKVVVKTLKAYNPKQNDFLGVDDGNKSIGYMRAKKDVRVRALRDGASDRLKAARAAKMAKRAASAKS